MKDKEDLHCCVTVNGKALKLKVDTGAKCNVISVSAFKLVKNGEIINKGKMAKLLVYGGIVFNTKDTVLLDCETSNHRSYS